MDPNNSVIKRLWCTNLCCILELVCITVFWIFMYIIFGSLVCYAPGDQGVQGLIPSRCCNILSWRLIMNIFYSHSLLSTDSRRAVVIFWWKIVYNMGYPIKVWLGKLTTLDMTPMGWQGCKTSTQTNKQHGGEIRTLSMLKNVILTIIWASERKNLQ